MLLAQGYCVVITFHVLRAFVQGSATVLQGQLGIRHFLFALSHRLRAETPSNDTEQNFTEMLVFLNTIGVWWFFFSLEESKRLFQINRRYRT